MTPNQQKQMSILLINQAKLWESICLQRQAIERIAHNGFEIEEDRQLAKAICSIVAAGFSIDDMLKKNPDLYFGEN